MSVKMTDNRGDCKYVNGQIGLLRMFLNKKFEQNRKEFKNDLGVNFHGSRFK